MFVPGAGPLCPCVVFVLVCLSYFLQFVTYHWLLLGFGPARGAPGLWLGRLCFSSFLWCFGRLSATVLSPSRSALGHARAWPSLSSFGSAGSALSLSVRRLCFWPSRARSRCLISAYSWVRLFACISRQSRHTCSPHEWHLSRLHSPPVVPHSGHLFMVSPWRRTYVLRLGGAKGPPARGPGLWLAVEG